MPRFEIIQCAVCGEKFERPENRHPLENLARVEIRSDFPPFSIGLGIVDYFCHPCVTDRGTDVLSYLWCSLEEMAKRAAAISASE
jgi:hypothetical protein